MGLAAHPNTVLSATKKASSEHLETVHQFFKDTVENEYMITVFNDNTIIFIVITVHLLPPKPKYVI